MIPASFDNRFQLEAVLLQFIFKNGLPKKIIALCDERQVEFKIAKHLRPHLPGRIQPGMPVRISGTAKWDRDGQKLKRKVWNLESASPTYPCAQHCPIAKRCIQVCGKKDCWRRGGSLVHAELQRRLAASGASSDVQVQIVKCLGNCDCGPNLLCLPEGKIYDQVCPDVVCDILKRALGSNHEM